MPAHGVSQPLRGATTVRALIELAEMAEGSGFFDSLWVGDNLLA